MISQPKLPKAATGREASRARCCASRPQRGNRSCRRFSWKRWLSFHADWQ